MAVDGFSAFDVTEAGRGMGRGDREGHESGRILFDQTESGIKSVGEDRFRFDQVIGGEHGEDRIGIRGGEHRGGEADRVEGVAAARLSQNSLVIDRGDGGSNLISKAFAGADPSSVGLDHVSQSITGDFEEASAVDQGDQLLGALSAADGPEPGAGTAGHDHCVSHAF